jgi:hypothetical protein
LQSQDIFEGLNLLIYSQLHLYVPTINLPQDIYEDYIQIPAFLCGLEGVVRPLDRINLPILCFIYT